LRPLAGPPGDGAEHRGDYVPAHRPDPEAARSENCPLSIGDRAHSCPIKIEDGESDRTGIASRRAKNIVRRQTGELAARSGVGAVAAPTTW
jgi:hypothetical protein